MTKLDCALLPTTDFHDTIIYYTLFLNYIGKL